MYDEARTVDPPGRQRRRPDEAAYERAQAHFATLLHQEVLPVIEAGCERLEAALAALATGREGETTAVIATTAALGELKGTEHRLRQALEAALESDPDPELVRQLMACGRRLSARARCSFDFHDTRSAETPIDVERALLHIGIEALEGAACHAGATQVRVRLADRVSGVELTVADNGTGLGHASAFQSGNLGLRLMDRRARSMGGWVRVEPGLVGGTIVSCWLPLPPEQPPGLDQEHPPGLDQEHPAAS
jgi:signal transduction histidine kinase